MRSLAGWALILVECYIYEKFLTWSRRVGDAFCLKGFDALAL
jgi:hypothetical protein